MPMTRRSRPSLATGLFMLSAVFASGGCGGSPASNDAMVRGTRGATPPVAQITPDPTPKPTPVEVLDQATVNAIEIREQYGLQSDIEWVRAVADDPDALIPEDWGIPLLPDELADLLSRRWPNNLIVQLRAYGEEFPDDFATAYINLKASGAVVEFKANLEKHRALLAALPLDGPVEVRQADWSLKELKEFLQQVMAEKAWIESTGAKWVQPVIYELENRVVIRYEGRRELEDVIESHFGSPTWLKARWEGP